MALGSGISASLGKGEGTVHVNIQQIIVFVGFILDEGVCIRKSVKLGEGFTSELFFIPVSLLSLKKKNPHTALFSSVASTHPLLYSLYVFFFFCLSAQQYRTHAVRDNRVMKPDRDILCVVFCRINWRQKEKKGGRYEVK